MPFSKFINLKRFGVGLLPWLVDLRYAIVYVRHDKSYWLLSSFGMFINTAAITITLIITYASLSRVEKNMEKTGMYYLTGSFESSKSNPNDFLISANNMASKIDHLLSKSIRHPTVPAFIVTDANVETLAGTIKVSILAVPSDTDLSQFGIDLPAGFRFASYGDNKCVIPQSIISRDFHSNSETITISPSLNCQIIAKSNMSAGLRSLINSENIILLPLENYISTKSTGKKEDIILISLQSSLSFDDIDIIFRQLNLQLRLDGVSINWKGISAKHFTVLIENLLSAVFLVACLAWLTSAISISSSVLFSMRNRFTEIGIRLAVGALRINLIRQFMFEASFLVVAGLLSGWVVAVPVAMVFIYVSELPVTIDPRPFFITSAGSTFVIFLAVLLPLKRILSLNPAAIIKSVK